MENEQKIGKELDDKRERLSYLKKLDSMGLYQGGSIEIVEREIGDLEKRIGELRENKTKN